MTFGNPIVGGVTLIRPAIQSPNFVTGVSGWTVRADGSVEINNATIRGAISAGGGNVLLNAGGLHIGGGTDQFDINITAGFLARHDPADGTQAQMSPNLFNLSPADPSPGGNNVDFGEWFSGYDNPGAANESPFMQIGGVEYTGKSSPVLVFHGQADNDANPDSTSALDAFAFDINLLNDGTSGQVGYQRNLVNLNTGFNVPPAQLFKVNLGVTNNNDTGKLAVALGVTNYPSAFPVGATLYGLANIDTGTGASGYWYARWLPVSNTQFNVVAYNPLGGTPAGALTLAITLAVWVVA